MVPPSLEFQKTPVISKKAFNRSMSLILGDEFFIMHSHVYIDNSVCVCVTFAHLSVYISIYTFVYECIDMNTL